MAKEYIFADISSIQIQNNSMFHGIFRLYTVDLLIMSNIQHCMVVPSQQLHSLTSHQTYCWWFSNPIPNHRLDGAQNTGK